VVVASPYIASVVQRSLAELGCVNVRPVTLRQVAARVAGQAAQHARRELTGVLQGAAIRVALQDPTAAPLAPVAHHQSLHDGLGSLFRELRHLDDATSVLDSLVDRGTVPRASTATFHRFAVLSADFYGSPELARMAMTAAEDHGGAWVDSLGALILYLPSRLDALDVQMLGRLGRRVPVLAALAHLGEAAADALMVETAEQLATALGVTLVRHTSRSSKAHELDVISAPDPSEEARTVIRRLVGDLERGVPLWQIAVLYGDEEMHGGLVRQALDAAELPWHASTGRPLATCWAARSLLGLLGLPERRFAREAVLEWLSGRSPGDSDAVDPLSSIPVSTWDRLSRQAQVLEGARQWVERLGRLARALGSGSQRLDSDAEDGAGESTVPADAAAADAIARAVARLSADLDPPDDGATWDAFVGWASDLRARYVPTGATWRHPEGLHSSVDDRLDHPVVTSPGTTRGCTAAGPERACRPRRNGSTRLVADSNSAAIRGVTI
jgi:hypothetical protein